jgi:lysozyme family protein
MTAIDYKPFVERMIERYEGGYGWDAGDPGGPTKFGITCFDLAEHRHQKMDSMRRWAPIVRAMTIAEADDIYASKYATACDFNDLNAGPDCCVFDFGVNSGSSRSVKFAQRIVGTTVDGQLGPITRAAINGMNAVAFVNKLCDARLSFLRSLSTWSRFGRGWSSRVADLRGYSLKLATPVPHGIAWEPEAEEYKDKRVRIPGAFPKAYHHEDIAALEAAHATE